MPRPLSQRDIESFRTDLVAAATRLFAERGFGGVTMRAIAGELGVSPMTPYRYFRNRDEIFEAVRTDAFRRFGDHIAAAAAPHPCPIERIRAIGRAYVDFARSEPHAYRIMFQLDPPGGEDLDPLHHEALRAGWEVLHGTLREAVARGLLHGDPMTLAHVCWVHVHGVVTLHLADKLRLGRGVDEIVDALLDTFFHGSLARPLPDRPGAPVPGKGAP